jgi:hypothetical protein
MLNRIFIALPPAVQVTDSAFGENKWRISALSQ